VHRSLGGDGPGGLGFSSVEMMQAMGGGVTGGVGPVDIGLGIRNQQGQGQGFINGVNGVNGVKTFDHRSATDMTEAGIHTSPFQRRLCNYGRWRRWRVAPPREGRSHLSSNLNNASASNMASWRFRSPRVLLSWKLSARVRPSAKVHQENGSHSSGQTRDDAPFNFAAGGGRAKAHNAVPFAVTLEAFVSFCLSTRNHSTTSAPSSLPGF
jgi:hypothetical protein